MTKTIVVPLDGSPLAERALPTAAWLARELGAELCLITADLGDPKPQHESYLEDQAGSIGLSDVRTAVIAHRFAGAGISEFVESVPDPVLCMSTRGQGGLAEALLGTVSDEVLTTVQVPVVLVGPHCAAGEPPSRNLLVSIDGSDASFAVLPTVADWANRLTFAVQVVTVAQCGNTGLPDSRRESATRLVDETAARLVELGVDAEQHVLNSAYIGDVIAAFATGLPAAMIAVGTHGRSGLSGKALGSIATDVVRLSPCPVLVRRIPD